MKNPFVSCTNWSPWRRRQLQFLPMDGNIYHKSMKMLKKPVSMYSSQSVDGVSIPSIIRIQMCQRIFCILELCYHAGMYKGTHCFTRLEILVTNDIRLQSQHCMNAESLSVTQYGIPCRILTETMCWMVAAIRRL